MTGAYNYDVKRKAEKEPKRIGGYTVPLSAEDKIVQGLEKFADDLEKDSEEEWEEIDWEKGEEEKLKESVRVTKEKMKEAGFGVVGEEE